MTLSSLLAELNKLATSSTMNMPVVFREPREEDYFEIVGAEIDDGKVILDYEGFGYE
jgi:hypothetical protein